MSPSTPAVTVLGSLTVPGCGRSVGEVRRFAADVLGPDHPCLDDVRLCLSELATNALRHSASGLPGGRIHVLIADLGDGTLRVEVTDDGPGTQPDTVTRTALTTDVAMTTAPGPQPGSRDGGVPETGRGLPIVDALSARRGVRAHGDGSTVWAEFVPAT